MYQGKEPLLPDKNLSLNNPQDILDAFFDPEITPVQYEKGGFAEGRISTHHIGVEPHKRGEKEGDDAAEFSISLIDELLQAEPEDLAETSGRADAADVQISRLNRALRWFWPLIGQVPYGWWIKGPVPAYAPAWALNQPCPSIQWLQTQSCFCAGVPNLLLRAVGKRVPTFGNLLFDGGVRAYGIYFRDFIQPFRLSDIQPGDLIGRYYRGSHDQGHVGVVLNGNVLLQSFDGNTPLKGTFNGPGINRRWTVAQSANSLAYEWRVHRNDWINYQGDETHQAVA